MKIHEWNQMMSWLKRKKPSPKERADVLQWIDYNNGKFGTEEQAKEYKKKYATVANKYDESEGPAYVEPKELLDIKKSLPVSELVKKPKKKIVKKTLVVEKPKTKPVPISPLPYDWREGIWHDLEDEDPYYNWQPKPSEDVRKILNIKNKEAAEGIKSILRLHRRLT